MGNGEREERERGERPYEAQTLRMLASPPMLATAASRRFLSTLSSRSADWVIPPIADRERDIAKTAAVEKRVLNCILRPLHPGVYDRGARRAPQRPTAFGPRGGASIFGPALTSADFCQASTPSFWPQHSPALC